jgi:multiple sugar transport system permease protein
MAAGARRPIGEAGWGWTLGAGIVSFIYFFPVLWIILTAFKQNQDALAIPPVWFFTPTLDNFREVFFRSYSAGAEAVSTGFDLFFFNSVFVSSASVVIALVLGTAAAYGFSRFPLKGNDTYLFVILTTRMMPAIVVIIPIFLMFQVIGLAGSYTGIILLYTAFNLPFTVWMMKSFFDELSPDVEDAARMDGSSEIKVFFRICLPQVLAGIAATAVFGLILTWNEFLFALLLTATRGQTTPIVIANFQTQFGLQWGPMTALACLYSVPVVVLTLFLQRRIVAGLTLGAVKG